MNANEVKSFNWVPVEDWSGLSRSRFDSTDGKLHFCEKDVDDFVNKLFKDIAQRLNIPFAELEPILRAENAAFYQTKKNMFMELQDKVTASKYLQGLKSMLRIPEGSHYADALA